MHQLVNKNFELIFRSNIQTSQVCSSLKSSLEDEGEYGAMVEWHCQGQTETTEEKINIKKNSSSHLTENTLRSGYYKDELINDVEENNSCYHELKGTHKYRVWAKCIEFQDQKQLILESSVLPEQLIVPQLVKKFPRLHETRRFRVVPICTTKLYRYESTLASRYCSINYICHKV